MTSGCPDPWSENKVVDVINYIGNDDANTYWHWSGRSSAWWGSWLLGLLTAQWEECGAVVGDSGCHLLQALEPKIP
jgi:hypothetical protein